MSTLDIIAKPANERTLEERIILLEKHVEDLEKENYFLRVSVEGCMILGRKIEKQYQESDKILSWLHKVINNNYNFIINH